MEGMDQYKSHKIAALTQRTKVHTNLIKLTQLLVSVSIFSFFFPASSLLALLHHFNICFSTFALQLFTHTIDKNCMFLLCNGLLVFVGIIRSLSGPSGVDEPSKYVEDGSQSQYSDVEANEPTLVEKKVKEKISEAEQEIEIRYSGEEEEEEEEENIEEINLEDEEERKRSDQLVLEEEEEPDEETALLDAEVAEEDKESEIVEFLIEENYINEEEVVVGEENWVMSTEELNKKFDDFIRRMKEDLRIEAQQHLVMV